MLSTIAAIIHHASVLHYTLYEDVWQTNLKCRMQHILFDVWCDQLTFNNHLNYSSAHSLPDIGTNVDWFIGRQNI